MTPFERGALWFVIGFVGFRALDVASELTMFLIDKLGDWSTRRKVARALRRIDGRHFTEKH